MSYKTILVEVDDTRHVEPRIEAAAMIALNHDAHLIGMAVTGVSRFLYETLAVAPDHPDIAPHVETLRQRAHKALGFFENVARRVGVVSFEKRLVDDEAAGGFSLAARCSDLVVLGQADENDPAATTSSDFPEYVVMNCGVPTLIVPLVSAARNVSNRVMVCWNASKEATRAVHGAIPLLRRADKVAVVMFNPDSQPHPLDLPPGGEIDSYLARHGVNATLVEQKTDRPIGEALLTHASATGTDLVVMGCYGHSRFREILLGGATHSVLKSMTVPVLMSH